MSRGGILWRGLLVAIAVAGCSSISSTTHYKVTIRVNGDDYTSDVVGQIIRDEFSSTARPSPYGSVMTFRLPDDRVIVLGTVPDWSRRLQCVPRLDQSDTGCKSRWLYPDSRLRPEGYVFNNATDPKRVEAFQFGPRDSEFIAKGHYVVPIGRASVPISDLIIEMVSYSAVPSKELKPRDKLDRDFPGYALTRFRDGEWVEKTNPVLSAAARDIGLPLAKDR